MNIPSIYKIEYLLPEDIALFDYDPGEVVDISAHLSGTFTELPISGTASLSSSMNKYEAGVLYEVESSFQKAGKDESVVGLLHNLSERDRIYRFTDVEGRQYLVGTKNNPAKLSFNEANDQEPTGFRGYNCSISWRSASGIIYLS